MFWKKCPDTEIRCNEDNKDKTNGDNLSCQDTQYLKSQTEILVNQKYSNDKNQIIFIAHAVACTIFCSLADILWFGAWATP